MRASEASPTAFHRQEMEVAQAADWLRVGRPVRVTQPGVSRATRVVWVPRAVAGAQGVSGPPGAPETQATREMQAPPEMQATPGTQAVPARPEPEAVQ